MSSSDATMSSPLFVPQALQFYVNRLSFSKNRVRLQALSTQVASANSQVIVRLPSNTMVNLASLTMTGGVRATISGTDTATEGVALPTNWDFSFIETLSLIANGGIITQPFINYKLLGNTLNDVYGTNDKIAARNALQGSLPSPLQPSQVGYQPFSINNWISATQTMAPSYISTNLLGDLELRLTMTDNSILQSGFLANGNVKDGLQERCAWDMRGINFYIETASIQSNMLEQAIAAKLAGGEPINVPFENVFSFQQTNDSGTYNQRFSVSSQSVNKILAVSQRNIDVRPQRPDTSDPPVLINGATFFNGIPSVFRRNYCGCKFAQFSVNNQYSPNYQIDSQINTGTDLVTGETKDYSQSNVLVETRAAMDVLDYDYESADKLTSYTQMPFEYLGGATTAAGNYIQQPSEQIIDPDDDGVNVEAHWVPYEYKSGLEAFRQDKWIIATSFDLDVCDKDRLVSGINTLGSNAQMFLNVVGGSNSADDGPNQSTIFVLCTSMVQIYQGATLQIIQ